MVILVKMEEGLLLSKKFYLTVITILIASNLITFLYSAKETTTYNKSYTFKSSNFSDHWKLSGYGLSITPTIIKSGNGKLYYLGDINNIKTAKYFELNVYVTFKNNERELLQRNSISGHVYDAGYIDVGSVENSANKFDKLGFEEIKEIFAVVKWETENGQNHEERINL